MGFRGRGPGPRLGGAGPGPRGAARGEHRLVVGLGVENLVVVETDDAVLIADRARAQEIKKVVKEK